MFPFFALGAILLAVSWRWRIAYVVLSIATFAEHVRGPDDALPGQPGRSRLARHRRGDPVRAGRRRHRDRSTRSRSSGLLAPAARRRARETAWRRATRWRAERAGRPEPEPRAGRGRPSAATRRAVAAPRWRPAASRGHAAGTGRRGARRSRRCRPGREPARSAKPGSSAGSAACSTTRRSAPIAVASLDARAAAGSTASTCGCWSSSSSRRWACARSGSPSRTRCTSTRSTTPGPRPSSCRAGATGSRTTSTSGPIRTSPSTRWPAGSSLWGEDEVSATSELGDAGHAPRSIEPRRDDAARRRPGRRTAPRRDRRPRSAPTTCAPASARRSIVPRRARPRWPSSDAGTAGRRLRRRPASATVDVDRRSACGGLEVGLDAGASSRPVDARGRRAARHRRRRDRRGRLGRPAVHRGRGRRAPWSAALDLPGSSTSRRVAPARPWSATPSEIGRPGGRRVAAGRPDRRRRRGDRGAPAPARAATGRPRAARATPRRGPTSRSRSATGRCAGIDISEIGPRVAVGDGGGRDVRRPGDGAVVSTTHRDRRRRPRRWRSSPASTTRRCTSRRRRRRPRVRRHRRRRRQREGRAGRRRQPPAARPRHAASSTTSATSWSTSWASRPDGRDAAAPWTVYVIEPHANAVFADARLPDGFEPVAWADGHRARRTRPTTASSSWCSARPARPPRSTSARTRSPGGCRASSPARSRRPCLYLLARILFRRRLVAGLVARCSCCVDGMFFVQSRIGMNDVYVGLFIIAAYTRVRRGLDGLVARPRRVLGGDAGRSACCWASRSPRSGSRPTPSARWCC